MATREIKATLALDGEQKFNSQIKSAQRNLRTMKTEVKAEAAAFDANGKAMEANEARLKSLQEQQKQQQVIVKALEGALEDAKKKYGENSTQVDAYRTKLANARAELTNMEVAQRRIQTENAKTGKSFQELKKDVVDNWNDVASQMGDALKNVATIAAGVFASVAASAAAVGKTVVDWTVNAGHQADDLLTESAVTGIDTTSLQQWQYASNFIDTSVDTIAGSIKKLRQNMGSTSDDMADAFRFFGVRLTDSAGQYRDAADVFWDIIDRVSTDKVTFANETETGNMMQKVFGKGYDELKPLLMAGRGAWEDLGAEAMERDLVMDEATLTSFGNFDDTLNRINANMQAIQNGIAEKFLPGIQDSADAVDTLTSTFNKFLHGDATPEEVAQAAADTVDAVIGALEQGIEVANSVIAGLQASDDPNVKAIGNMLADVRDAGLDLWKNKDKIVTAAEAIIGVWAIGKIANAINNITKFAGSVGKLVGSMVDLISNAGAYATAVETVQGAGAAGAAGAGIPSAAGAVALPAAVAAGASIFAKTMAEKAAEAAAKAAYDTTEGTEKEKQTAASNARYEVLEPGAVGAMEIAKWITGVTQREQEHQKDQDALKDTEQFLIGAGGIFDQDADVVASLEKTGAKADKHFEDASKSAEDVSSTVIMLNTSVNSAMNDMGGIIAQIESTVDSTMDDLREFVNLSNWRRAIERGDVQSNMEEYNGIVDALDAIDAKYGGSILDNTSQGQKYLGVLQSMSAGALDELPSIDAVFNLQPAEGTLEEMQAFVAGMDLAASMEFEDGTEAYLQSQVDQMHFEAPLYLNAVSTGFSASSYRSTLSPSAIVPVNTASTGVANVSINLDGRAIGNAVAPIVNTQLGRQLVR